MSGNSPPRIVAAGPDTIAEAAALLRDGALVALPTETVYGLAARADRSDAVARIYRAKGRPGFNPLIVHVGDVDAARELAIFDERALALAAAFWPGPLTLVLPLRDDAGLAGAVTAGLPTVALRSPEHPVMRAVLAGCGLPLAAPSANRSGAVSPTRAAHVAQSLGAKVDLVLDAGACAKGIESTIIALTGATGEEQGWRLLRPGPITKAQISAILGKHADVTTSAKIEAPGQLASHYSPGKPVRLNAATANAGEFHIGFGPIDGDANLSRSGDPAEAAAQLYDLLHRAAASDDAAIAIAPIPDEGLGAAINDRLRRAAA